MTIVADRAARSDVGPAGSMVGPRAGRPGAALAIVGMMALVGGLSLGSPALVLLGLVVTVAAPLRDWLPLDLAIPSGALLLLVTAVFAGLVAGAAGADLLAHPTVLAAGYLLASGAVLQRRLRSASRPAGVAPLPGGRHLVIWFPVAVALATGLLQAASLGVAKTWAFWGTDLARHMSVVARLQDHTALDYRTWPYPRGLELLAALVSVPGRPATPGLLLGYDLQLSAALTWFALALLAATGTSLAVRAALALGLSGWTAALAGLLVGAGALTTNTFVLSFGYLGAAPSLVAVAVLHGVPLLLLARPARQHRLAAVTLGCAAATVALAHLWQALVLAPVLAWVVLAVPELPSLPGLLRSRPSRRVLLLSVGAALLLGAMAIPPVLGVSSTAGLSYAAVPGELAGQPWRLLVAALVAVVVVVVLRPRAPWTRAVAATTLGMVVVTALLLRGTSDGLDLNQYYPQKSAWFLALALAPVLAVVVSAAALGVARWLWRLLGRTGRLAFVLRATSVGIVLGPLLALWLGFMVGVQASTVEAWRRAQPTAGGSEAATSELSAVRYDLARQLGRPTGRVVVPWDLTVTSFDPYGTRTMSLLLAFQTGQPEMLLRGDLCEQVRWTAGRRPALVATQRPAASVRRELARGGCGDGVVVRRMQITGYVD